MGGYQPFDTTPGTYERISQRGPYLTGNFFDNMFISVGGGLNLYMGHGDPAGDFGKRLSPALDIAIGKWITPNMGLRLSYNGLNAKGFSPVRTRFTDGAMTGGLYDKKFNLLNIRGDVLWNLSNTIGGYRKDRTWNIIPFIGAGVVHASKNGRTSTQFAPTVGLLNNFRLGDVVDIFLEGRLLALKGDFDGFKGGKPFDGMTSLTLGLTFKLGPKDGFKRPYAPIAPDYSSYLRRIEQLERENADDKARIDRLNRELEECRNRPAPKPEVINGTPASMTVFFEIGSAALSAKSMVNLERIAKYMKEGGSSYRVVGYADNQTGSKRRNEQLSLERATAVANALANLGVDRNKLVVSSMGGVSNCAENPSLCRMVEIE